MEENVRRAQLTEGLQRGCRSVCAHSVDDVCSGSCHLSLLAECMLLLLLHFILADVRFLSDGFFSLRTLRTFPESDDGASSGFSLLLLLFSSSSSSFLSSRLMMTLVLMMIIDVRRMKIFMLLFRNPDL